MKHRSYLVIALSVILLVVIAVACGPVPGAQPAAQPQTSEQSQAEAGQEPMAESVPQVIRVGLDGEPTHLDAAAPPEDLVEYTSSQPIHDALLEYSFDGEMKIVGNLATEWEWVDPQTFKFSLRKGVKFHDGHELTMDDVKYTFEHVKDPATGSKLESYIKPVAEVEIVDPYTGILHLEAPFAPLETYVLQKIYIVADGSTPEERKTNPNGTGPFRFKEWVKGEKVVLEKNPDYWKPDKPHLDEIVLQFFPQYQTAVNSLRAGDTDIILWLNNADAEPMSQEPGIRLEEKTLYGNFYIGFNLNSPPFDDVNVRKAIKYGVDKQLVLERAQLGFGSAVDINETPGSPFYTPDFDYQQNIEQAKEYLAAAGLADGFSADLVIPLTPTEGPIGEAVAFSLSEIGLDITPVKMKVPEFIDATIIRKDYPFMICGYAGVPDPDFWDYKYLHSEGSVNPFHYSNPRVDELLDEARATPDLEQRQELYHEIFDLAYTQDVPVVWLINEYRFMAIRDQVKDFQWNKAKIYEYEDVTIEP